ncbi:MAG TPA: DUF1761 domain-containing protein [Opitutaceae bacterium]|jgi:hypothetical protein
MIDALKSLNPAAVIVVSVAAFAVGALWYFPLLFVKAWLSDMRIDPAKAREEGKKRMPVVMSAAFLCTIVSTLALAVLIASHHVAGPVKGAEFGLLAGAGLVAARQAVNSLFEMRTLRLFLIVAGHDVVQFAVAGAILGAWR